MTKDYFKVTSVCVLLVVLFSSCLRNNGISNEIGTWSFSGVVVDGSTEKSLSAVSVSYVDDEGEVHSSVCDAEGKFFIDKLPFGERTFVFTYTGSDSTYTKRKIVASSYAEASSLGGVIGDVSRIVQLYPLTGSISGVLVYEPHETEYQIPAASATVRVTYQDSAMQNTEPVSFSAEADSSGEFSISGLPLAPGGVISFDKFKKGDATYTLSSKSFNTQFTKDLGKLVYITTDTLGWATEILNSNVLSKDGFGKTGVSVTGTVWYRLPVSLQAGSVLASMNGVGSPSIETDIADDTLFLNPRAQLPYDTLIEVGISGFTAEGEKFEITLDGIRRFRTEKCSYPVEANFWSQPWNMSGRFNVGEPLWVRFSEELDNDKESFKWTTSSAASTVYGSGANVNSTIRVSGDTLFVTPDQRLNYTYNSTIGFNVRCMTADGKYLKFYDFAANTIEDPLFIVWTNTKDEMGNSRIDMGLRDTLKLLPSVGEFDIVGFSAGSSGPIPPGLLLSDMSFSDDTLICTPSLSLLPDTTYSLDFDVQFEDGRIRRNVLGMSWSTKKKVSIVATDTKRNGMYRPLKAINDSFRVTFSEPIDTSADAAVAFRVNMVDVTDTRKRTLVSWDEECLTATITFIDTLPTADFDAPAAYTSTAQKTKAVESVTFDLVTRSGEQVLGCRPDGDPLALHTEKGMCVVQTNIVPYLDGRTSVEKDFTPTSKFPSDGAVELQFSRSVDTGAMKMDSLTMHFGIHKEGAVVVPVTVTVSSDQKTVQITPQESLDSRTEYYVYVKNVPAVGIAGAGPISKHGGIFSGRSSYGYLLDRPFKTQ